MNTNTHSKDKQISMLNAAGQRFDAADPAIKSPQFHGDPMAPEGGIVVFQIFGAGELLPKMCEIGFAYTHAREVRHRQPWRGDDDDRTKAADARVAAVDPRTIHTPL